MVNGIEYCGTYRRREETNLVNFYEVSYVLEGALWLKWEDSVLGEHRSRTISVERFVDMYRHLFDWLDWDFTPLAVPQMENKLKELQEWLVQ